VSPADLLTLARDVLRSPAPAAAGSWPHAVSLLARQALEQAVDEFWAASPATAGLCGCTMRTQLICLPMYLDRGLAHDISYLWAALSSACHYHLFGLAPTAIELSGWIDSVATLLAAMSVATAAPPGAAQPGSEYPQLSGQRSG